MKRSHLTLVTLAAVAALAGGSSAAPAATHSAARAATVKTAASSLGRILVDGRGRTLYMFEKDKRGRSFCAGACATYWPPLRAHGKPIAGRGAKLRLLGAHAPGQRDEAGDLRRPPALPLRPGHQAGTDERQDSHAFGAGWYVLSPAGKKVAK